MDGDHPRGCGENVYVFPCVRNKPGSPPRMRGKRTYAVKFALDYGITPADAGKTSAAEFFYARYWDHPRGCGENIERPYVIGEALGSPPRMRGKPTVSVNLSSSI